MSINFLKEYFVFCVTKRFFFFWPTNFNEKKKSIKLARWGSVNCNVLIFFFFEQYFYLVNRNEIY